MSADDKLTVAGWVWVAAAIGTYAVAWVNGLSAGVGIATAGLICSAFVGWML